MKILHITDLHAGCSEWFKSHKRIETNLIELINTQAVNFIAVSGDITYRGKKEHYEKAKSFFETIISNTSINKECIIFCPGNHDLVNETDLGPFDAFTYSVRTDRHFLFKDTPCNLYLQSGIAFLSLNSVYHLNRQYGFIDLKKTSELLSENKTILEKASHRIAIFHHNIIGTQRDDQTAIRNAYNVIALLDRYEFQVIFHGHQHGLLTLKIGIDNILQCIGNRTLLMRDDCLECGLVVYDLENSTYIVHTILRDKIGSDGLVGALSKGE